MFFPTAEYTQDNFDSYFENDELDTHQGSIGNILKGALLDELIIEVQINSREEIFHCRLLDKSCQKISNASYIDSYDEIYITPLEPSIGNVLLFKSTEAKARVMLRIVEQNTAVELACFFSKRLTIDNLPALQLTFPFIIRRISSAREYRAKVTSSMKFKVVVSRRINKQFSTVPVNISHSGIALIDPMAEQSTLEVGEEIQLEMQVPKVTNFLISGSIAHMTKLRRSSGTQHIIGIEFTNSIRLKEEIEHLVAAVIKAHNRERDVIASEYGILYDDW